MTNNLKAERTLTAERIEELLKDDIHDRNLSPRARSDLAEALSELQSLRSKPVAGVEVKPLEWGNGSGGDEISRCAVGVYGVGQGLDFISCIFRSANDDEPDLTIYHGDNRSDAKDAAEADYRQRILSALILPTHKPLQEEG
jgi:hypothetical protein